jgi:hypothetical protein
MATHDNTEIHHLIEKMHDLLQELERACIASRVAWRSFLRLQEDIRIQSNALRPIRRGLYRQRTGSAHSSAG